ncbi:MAG TPA: glutathione S-transferase N-terminal domain-containing protein [Gammaproteobacteria bacterium]|nr:glutathione S-transferase N-terminal domain-containing protein [Gammaproteobacteria bacterium]
MNQQSFRAKAYVKEGCPFSFKFLVFMAEAGLMDRIEIKRVNPDAPDFETVKAKLAAGLGKPATFPTVEIAPGRYMSDSDALIRYYASRNDAEPDQLPALSLYKETIFPKIRELHELKSGAKE